jgi:hypothetical protein
MGKVTLEKFLNYKKIKDINEIITEKQYVEINKIINHYDSISIKNRLQNIRDFIINKVEDRWLGRLRIIVRKLKNDVISEYSCKIRYGENWEIKRNILKDKVRMDKDNFIKKYGEEEGIKRWEERNNKTISYGLNPAIKKYGEEEGTKRWLNTLERKILTMRENKKIRPYRNGRTLPEYQKKYGVKVGYQKWMERNQKQKHRFSLNYFLEKYGEIKGIEEWKNYCQSMSKTTLNTFIDRYGKEDGENRYNLFINRLKYTQSKDFFIEKYGEEIGVNKYNEFILTKLSHIKDSYSKISQKLFWGIYEKLNDGDREKCYFYELNSEYTFYVWTNDMTIINVDFKLNNKVIEFDGDYWHSKKEQIEKDKKRDDFLLKKGYHIKRIKEKDYKNNRDIIINECLEFLKE